MNILMLLENDFQRDPRVEKEVEVLYKAGHNITVLAITLSDPSSKEQKNNCTVFRRKISKFIFKSSVGALKFDFYFNFWREYLNEIFSDHKFDALHIHDLPLSQIGIEFKKKYQLKLVIDLHENWPALMCISAHTNTLIGKILSSEKQWRAYEKECASKADRIITVVGEMKQRLLRLGIPEEKIYVLENTPVITSENIRIYERDSNYLTLIYIGGIAYHRGLQYVISGIKLLEKQIPVRLWIAGDGKYTPVLRKQVDELNLRNQVEFFGMVSKSETEDLMKKADFGLIPHIRSEQSDNSSPNKLFEYMSAGLPVIASDCISVKRIIAETQCGMTYVFDSPDDFSNVVRRLFTDREKTTDFAENGIKAIREKYNWTFQSKTLLDLYSNL